MTVNSQEYPPHGMERSIDLQRAFASMSAETTPKVDAIDYKRRIVQEVTTRNLLPIDILREYPTVYVCSGLDIEYPLLLGARKIVMVDPIFEDEAELSSLQERLKGITQSDIQVDSDTFSFEFDFGEGRENVDVSCAGVLYSRQGTESFREMLSAIPRSKTLDLGPPQREFQYFKPPAVIGMLLGFRTAPGADIDDNEEALSRLIKGGVILVDSSLNIGMKALDGGNDFAPGHEKRKIERIRSAYEQKGLEFVELETEGDNINYTFVRKSN